MKNILVIFVLVMLAVAPCAAARQQVTDESSVRPRVGLVLGGGGARGAAHIGVLKELERRQIPIDAIAGTSMGAIIGGLYATGMSAAELEELLGSLDWARALSDRPDREDLSFRRKQDEREYPINFELGLRGKDFVLPGGVIQGQKLDLLLRELTAHASDVRDFDRLPIPFRAVAADIAAGEAVILKSGDLAKSIRASMSVPGAFAPARIGDRLLVDGGLVGNLPIDVVRQMDVDVVIAVDVEFPLYKLDELDSVLTVTEQMLTILIRKETLRQVATLGENDVLIRPALGTFASTNFGGTMDAIEPGEEAARQQSNKLAGLSVGDAEWQSWLARRNEVAPQHDKLAFVRIRHDDTLSPRVLQTKLDVEPGDAVDPVRLARNANRLYGMRLFEQVDYNLVEENGATGVEYHAIPKRWGRNYLQFGVALEDDFDGSTGFNLSTRLTRSGINRLGAEWRADLQLGTDPAVNSEFYQPLSFDSRLFFAPRVSLQQTNFNVFDNDRRLARYRITEGELSLDAGRELGTIGEFRIGAYRGGGNARVKVGDPQLPNLDFETGGAFARLRFDTVDDSRFPRSGTIADLHWNLSRPGFGADSDFDTIEADISHTWSRGKSSLQLGLGYATTLRSKELPQDYFPLGGFLRLSGLELGEIAGPHAALTRLVYYRRIGDRTGGIFETPTYFGVSAEAGNVWQRRSEMSFGSMQLNGSVFAGMDTYFGPVFLAAGFAEDGQSNFYLFIGSPPR